MSESETSTLMGEGEWWGEYSIEPEKTLRWRVGALGLWVQRMPGEWRVAQERDVEQMPTPVMVEHGCIEAEQDESLEIERFAVRGTSPTLRFQPALADRPIVSQPDIPFHLPAGEKVVVYVGSPLWVQLVTQSPEQHTLFDQPIGRPSDTWFGPTDADGEICYASRTFCRLNLDDVPIRADRCTTAVTIRNRSNEDLPLERLKIPVDSLALYVDEHGRFWTQDVTLERWEQGDHARMTIRKQPPAAATAPRHLAPARTPERENIITRAFATLFH